jgi:stage V sporulation protein AE
MQYLWAFLIGGGICALIQVLLDKTKITAARLLAGLVILGALLQLFGLYEPFHKFAGAGASVPISGFGYVLAKGTIEAVNNEGIMGVLTGGLTATSSGIAAVVFFSWIAALIAKARKK